MLVEQDGDALCFGAVCVIKTLSLKNDRDVELEAYSAADIKARLKLSRRDLIGAMLLLGCDFSSGVKLMGPQKSRVLLHSLSSQPQRSAGTTLYVYMSSHYCIRVLVLVHKCPR